MILATRSSSLSWHFQLPYRLPLWSCGLPTSRDGVEQLAQQARRIHLIIVLAGGERQQLAEECRIPRCRYGHVEAVHRRRGAYTASISD